MEVAEITFLIMTWSVTRPFSWESFQTFLCYLGMLFIKLTPPPPRNHGENLILILDLCLSF